MKKSSIGHYYENFRDGRVFINSSDKCITIKGYKTWKGKHYEQVSWICLSLKSQRPIIYKFIPQSGIINITYQQILEEELNSLLNRISSKSEKDEIKRKVVKEKFLEGCNQFFQKDYNFQSLNAHCLKTWMPLLNHYQDDDVIELLPILNQPLVRQGLKKDSLTSAVNIWFGRSTKGLTRRIANILEKKQFCLFILSLSCRTWNLDYLYALLDSDIIWDSDIDIKKAGFLLSAYPEKKWLRLLKKHSKNSRDVLFDTAYVINDIVSMFYSLKDSYSLPKIPGNFYRIHDDLAREYRIQKASYLRGHILPQQFSALDGVSIGQLRLVTPKISDDLILWSQQLNNCLVSYIEQVLSLEYYVIGVKKDSKIKYALGIVDRHIEQFCGINNSNPTNEDYKLITEVLS